MMDEMEKRKNEFLQFLEEFVDNQKELTPEEEEAERKREYEWFLTTCGSCKNFFSLMGEAGMCKLGDNNCLCENPKAMIDMFDHKCEKWEISEEEQLKQDKL